MRLRFPLYAKLLLWFFLNLVVLGGAFLLLVRAQFHYGLDWLLAAGAGERIQAISDVIVSELNDRPRSEWDAVLKRFDDAYQIQFLIFRADGSQLAGALNPLPPEVRMRLGEGRGAGGFRPPLDAPAVQGQPPEGPDRDVGAPDRPAPGPRPGREGVRPDFPRGPAVQARGPHPKFIVRTTSPTRYWLIVRAPINDPERPRSGPLVHSYWRRCRTP